MTSEEELKYAFPSAPARLSVANFTLSNKTTAKMLRTGWAGDWAAHGWLCRCREVATKMYGEAKWVDKETVTWCNGQVLLEGDRLKELWEKHPGCWNMPEPHPQQLMRVLIGGKGEVTTDGADADQ